MKCQVCEQETGANGLRFGVCWDCATAESIIDEGTNMYDEGLNGEPAKKAMDKVRMLLRHGWQHGGTDVFERLSKDVILFDGAHYKRMNDKDVADFTWGE